jgi:hypothetical protein
VVDDGDTIPEPTSFDVIAKYPDYRDAVAVLVVNAPDHGVYLSGCCLTIRQALMIASALRFPSATLVSQLITESLMM